MPQHIGIVACSAEGAALCYRTICVEGAALLGPHAHPEVSMHTPSLADYMAHIYRDDWPRVAELMLASADKLKRAGADFLICPDNTIHQALPHVAAALAAALAAHRRSGRSRSGARGFRRIGITGTRWLVDSEVYPEKLSARGLAYLRPGAAEREEVQPHHHGRAGLQHLQAGVGRLLPAGDRTPEGRRAAMPSCWAAPRSR